MPKSASLELSADKKTCRRKKEKSASNGLKSRLCLTLLAVSVRAENPIPVSTGIYRWSLRVVFGDSSSTIHVGVAPCASLALFALI